MRHINISLFVLKQIGEQKNRPAIASRKFKVGIEDEGMQERNREDQTMNYVLVPSAMGTGVDKRQC